MIRVTPLKVGVIGVGKQGREHLSAIEHLVSDGKLSLVGICDINAQMAKSQADRLQTSWFTNAVQLVREEKPELVVLSVPNNAYDEIIRFCISERVNILKEKPLALTYAQGKSYLQLAKKNDIVFVTSQQRYYNSFAAVRHWLGEVGEILLFDYDFVLRDVEDIQRRWYWDGEAGGGCWYGLGWHACFLISWYLGLPDQIRVRMFRSKRRNWPYQADDTTVFECSYKNGPLVRGFVSMVGVEKREQLFIQGTKGSIQVDRQRAVLFDAKGTVVEQLDSTSTNPYVKQLEGIASAINARSNHDNAPMNTYIVDDRLTSATMFMISKGFESARKDGQSVPIHSYVTLNHKTRRIDHASYNRIDRRELL